MEELTVEFQDIEKLLDHIKSILTRVGLNNLRVKFPADVTNVSARGKYVYINVSQDYVERGVKRKIDLNMITYLSAFERMGKRLGLKSSGQLLGKKWEFQGTLSFYKPRVSFSIWVDTIAPLGESDITTRRREVYLALKSKNALRTVEHELSELQPVRKIAIISSSTAAGLGDFRSNLALPALYRPVVHLYESFMQGNETVPGILEALNRIKASPVTYDVVVITRGGGSASDLMYFDDLELGLAISDFNRTYCPVLSAIGHEKDSTIPDYVSWKSFDTPTAVARALTNQVNYHLDVLSLAGNSLAEQVQWQFERASVETTQERLKLFSSKIDDLSTGIASRLDESGRNMSERFLNSVGALENEIENYRPLKYALPIENALNNIFNGFEGVSNRADARVEQSFAFSNSLLEASALKASLGESIMACRSTLDSVEKSVVKTFGDIQEYLSEELETITAELMSHGGYAASLSYGGVVLKKDKLVINSIESVSPGDSLECYFSDGRASITIERVLKSEGY